MAQTSSAEMQTAQLLQQALAYLKANRPADAEPVLKRILAAQPAQPDALQLMGLMLKQRGQVDAAEDHFRRSLAANPRQPNVQRNLGNLLKESGRHLEAATALRAAIVLDPKFVEAYINLGVVLTTLREHGEAEKIFERALALDPNNVAALRNLVVLYTMAERSEDALALVDRLIRARGETADDLRDRGHMLQTLGRLDEAEQSYRRALTLDPSHGAAHEALAKLGWRRSNGDFLRPLTVAIDRIPDNAELAMIKGKILTQAGRFDEAVAAFEIGLKREPDMAPMLDAYARALCHQGRFDEAVAAHTRTVALAPDISVAHSNFAETLLQARDPERALVESEAAERLDPTNQLNIAFKGLAWRLIGDPREAWLNDYEALVKVYDLPPPDGFRDMDEFAAALDEFLIGMHADDRHPVDQTLRHGTQTQGSLFKRNFDLVTRLRLRIEDAIRAYVAAMPEDDSHPLLRRKSAGFAFSGSWSSCLRDNGFHTNHVHPMGWISSCFYVAVPEVAADAERKQGWIKFGEVDFDIGLNDMIRRTVQPRPGRLVLFPSCFWHGTIPFHGPEHRTTIAFDVLPKTAGA